MNSTLIGNARARKVGGSYQCEGTVVGTFYTLDNKARLVFEFDEPKGMLHIFNEDQIEYIQEQDMFKEEGPVR